MEDRSPYPVKLSYYMTENELRGLAGKILTFVDMAVVDKQSNKAWKDNIKQEFSKTFCKFQDICSEGKCGESVHLGPLDSNQLR